MGKLTVTPLIAALALSAGAAQAVSPTYLYGASTDAYGMPTAVTTTSGTVTNARAGYVVAAIPDSVGNLEVKAWQNTPPTLSEVGHYHASGSPITAVAAADLDSSRVVTADVDDEGKLSLRTWTVGGSAGIAPLASSTSGTGTALTLGALGIAALSATEVVTASQNSVGDLVLQAWTVGTTSTAPQKYGSGIKGGAVGQIAIAAIDSSTVITATTNTNAELVIATWSVTGDGVSQLDEFLQPTVVGGSNDLAIAAATVMSVNATQLPPVTYRRTAVTPIVNNGSIVEVLYWQISAAGVISLSANKLGGPEQYAATTAAVMLPSGVPMSVYNAQDIDDLNVAVGWFGNTGESEVTVITADPAKGLFPTLQSVAAAPAGDDFSPLSPYSAVDAYFVTGALTYSSAPPSPATPGEFKLQMWSYPVTLPLL